MQKEQTYTDVPNFEYLLYKGTSAMGYPIGKSTDILEAEVDTAFVCHERDIENQGSLN